ncbi:MAG: hypothetical protein WBA17_08960 [Saprospiraceae bacterium]
MPGLLGIHHFFPPGGRVSARRLRRLYTGGEAAGVGEVHVISAADSTDVPGVTLHRITGRSLRRIITGSSGATVSAERKKRWWFGPLNRLRQSFPFIGLLDEGGPGYRRRAAARGAALVEEHRLDRLFSSYRPWSDHLIARRIKKRFPHLHWTADFRDLPVDPVRRDVVWPRLQTRVIRRLLRGADELWAVSEGQAVWLRKLHPRVRVVRNPLLKLPPAQTAPKSELFTINYTGSCYPRLQSPALLYTALNKLIASGRVNSDHLRIDYTGKDTAVWRGWQEQYGGSEILHHYRETVTAGEAVELQQRAQINVLLSWSAAGYGGVLTAKLYDYLAAGRPIVALLDGPADAELNQLVEGTGSGRVFASAEPAALEELTNYLFAAYTIWLDKKTLPHRPDPIALKSLQVDSPLLSRP